MLMLLPMMPLLPSLLLMTLLLVIFHLRLAFSGSVFLVSPTVSAGDAYEQLKALLMSRYTKAHWTRAFKLLKYPELVDMKPTDLLRQMKALLLKE
jgi:hypothetical protein